MRDATNNLVEVNNVGSSFTTQLDRQLGCRRCVDSLGVEVLGLTYSYTGHLPYPAICRLDDRPSTSTIAHLLQRSPFQHRGTAFPCPSSCLVSGSHPSLEHGAVGNMRACLDSSCSLHRDFGCRLRVVLPEIGLVQKVHTNTQTNRSEDVQSNGQQRKKSQSNPHIADPHL